MIRCTAFDIDGVLADTKPIHQIAMLHSLAQHGFPVAVEYHKQHLDGLPTREKMERLGVPHELRESIFDLKQRITFECAGDFVKPNGAIQDIFGKLRNRGIGVAVCSNAIRRFCELTVGCLGVAPDILISNEDARMKPDPEMYLRVQAHFDCQPGELLVCEDSKFGLDAAYKSRACVCYIASPRHLTWRKLEPYIML